MFNNDFPTIFQRTCISTDEAPGSKRLERNSNHKTALLFIIFCGSALHCIDTVTYCSTLTVLTTCSVIITLFMVPQLNIDNHIESYNYWPWAMIVQCWRHVHLGKGEQQLFRVYRVARSFCGSLLLWIGDILCFAGTNFCD